MVRYTCPCCGYKTIEGGYDICRICNWEDDSVQRNDPDYRGGANTESLREAQKSFMKSGPSKETIRWVIKPNKYVKNPNWKPLKKPKG